MSHVYSLFLFTYFLYLGPFVSKKEGKKSHYFLFGLIIGLIIAVRPINFIFVPVYFIFNTFNFSDIKKTLSNYILVVVTAISVIIPQLFYWKYSFGSYFQYSYGEESFSNIFKPELLKLLFSTNNGLFIYNPLIIFCLAGLFFLFKSLPRISIAIAVYFIFISYLFSSWHDWGYGCSYGSRPYVEYLSILALPFGFFINQLKEKTPYKFVLLSLCIAFIIYNQKLIFSYDGCWYGGVWDWSELLKLIVSNTK
jgi:hypothetical protein